MQQLGRHRAAGSRTHAGQRHCEERSDEAIHPFSRRQDGLLRSARNDEPLSQPAVDSGGPGSIRSTQLTIFWHCGTMHFSFRTNPEARSGNEPSRVLAEDWASKGSRQC
jgi:hypothetical protein